MQVWPRPKLQKFDDSKQNQQVKAKEESSFCEQKEAKKLCHLEPTARSRSAPGDKSFLLLFFKKDASLLPYNLLISLIIVRHAAGGIILERAMIDLDKSFDFIATDSAEARPIHLIEAADYQNFLAELPPAAADFLRDQAFAAEAGKLLLLPGPNGVAGAVLGLGASPDVYTYGGLAGSLPAGRWRYAAPADDTAVLGFCLGAYRARPTAAPAPQLVVPPGHEQALGLARAIFMVRDLINIPANRLGPAELAAFAAQLGARSGAEVTQCAGADLQRSYPAVAAVGAGSARPAQVVEFHWQGSTASPESPLIALCGKGVVFDTGGYDLKPSAGMLRMKKDMGGSAVALGLARLIMEADLPVRLAVWIGCVENSVSGHAMRPSDIIDTRAGITVEVGNTDAEGRLVLCDLLTAACEHAPALLLDFATLTGAARVALGPDLPALFCTSDAWADQFSRAGNDVFDPVWRLPLWAGYRDWLKSPVADIANVATKPMAGAIIAALYLKSFVNSTTNWAHFDCYCWNDQSRPGRPEGGEATGLQGIWRAVHDAALNKSGIQGLFR